MKIRARIKPEFYHTLNRHPYQGFRYGTWLFEGDYERGIWIHKRTAAYFRTEELEIIEEVKKK